MGSLNVVLKTQLARFLGGTAGITIGAAGWRIAHQHSLLDWDTVRAIDGGCCMAFSVYCLCLWLWHRPQSSAILPK
jgi:hypothetical protein